MARYRPIHVSIWSDPDFENYPMEKKFLFIYLCTNNSTTESGIYPITPKRISNETGIPLKKVEEYLKNLKNVFYDFENHCVFVKNFYKYKGEKGRPDLMLKALQNDFNTIKTPLWHEFKKTYPEIYEQITKDLKPLENIEQTLDKPLENIGDKDKVNYKDIYKDNLKGNEGFKKPSDCIEDYLSQYLLSKIKKIKPDFKEPDLTEWSKQMGKIIGIDKRDPNAIKDAIDWAFEDSFWKTIILNPGKLRENFDQIQLKMTQQDEIEEDKISQELVRKAHKCYLSFNYGYCTNNYSENDEQCRVCKCERSNWRTQK